MPLPPDLAQRPLVIKYEHPSKLLRVFRTPPNSVPAPIYYSKSGTNRFDSPKGTFGVMYAAFDLSTCFAEAVTREQNRAPLSNRGIPVSDSAHIQPRFVVSLDGQRHLRLADVTDAALYGLGAEAGEFNSVNYSTTTQLWAEELFNRPESVDGIYYRSRFLNGRIAVAIFERGGDNIKIIPRNVVPLRGHAGYPAALQELNVSLLP